MDRETALLRNPPDCGVATLGYYVGERPTGSVIKEANMDQESTTTLSAQPISRIEVCNPLDEVSWDDAIADHPHASVFHTASWCRVLTKTYGHTPRYVRVTRRGRITDLVPLLEVASSLTGKRGVSLPFSDYCDALEFGEDGFESANRIFEAVRELADRNKWSHIEFRGSAAVPGTATPSVSFYAHKVDLRGGEEAVRRRFRPSVHRALRKPKPPEMSVAVCQTEEAMRNFYKLHALTRSRHGLPPQPYAFFRNIHREIIARDMGSVVVVRMGAKPIAAMVFFHWGKTGVYKFGASDKGYQHLRPNNLAMWTGMKVLMKYGCESLHFGRSSLANDGLRRFKLGWGAEESPLHYHRYDVRNAEWSVSRDRSSGAHTRFFRLLPDSLNRLAGRILYAHLD